MSLSRGPVLWGILLILAGVLLLAQNLGVFGELPAPVWTILFGVGSLAFFAAFFRRRGAWWFLFPACVLLGLAAVTLLAQIGLEGNLGGSLFLWAIAAAFWGVFATDRRQWWAIIPAGALTTIGLMPLADSRLTGDWGATVFFASLSATFGVLYVLRARFAGQTAWAIFPAAGCLAMALFLGALGPLGKFWPVLVLIVPGVYLLYRALRAR